MRFFWRLAPLAILLLADTLAAAPKVRKCDNREYRDLAACRQLVLHVDEQVDLNALAQKYDLRPLALVAPLGLAWVEAPLGADLPDLVRRMERGNGGRHEPGVTKVERNLLFASPECHQHNVTILEIGTGDDPLASQPAMHAVRADAVAGTAAGAGVLVAVLDTGVSRQHPALAGSLVSPAFDLLHGTLLADDVGNGRDDSEPQNGVVDEGWGHGSAVAGLIRTVAPGASILPVRVLDDECQGTLFSVAAGIIVAVDAGAQVINVSIGTPEKSDVLEKAVRYAARRGVLVVAAAGNREPGDARSNKMQYPAAYIESVLSVAAVSDDLIAPDWTVTDGNIALAAPGVELVVPYRDGTDARMSGTSLAAAVVSGAAAVALGVHPTLSRPELVKLLRVTSIPIDHLNPAAKGKIGEGVPDFERLARP